MDAPGPASLDSCTSRRQLLAAVTGLGSSVMLNGCTSQAAPVPTASAAAAPSGPQAPPQRLTEARNVPVGGGTLVDGVLVVQPVAGRFKAFDAACPHQGVQVRPPRDGVITCPAHMSMFAEQNGAVVRGPARRGLTRLPVEVKDDVIYLV
jgi:Rieske Fe-S protein